MSEEIAGSNIKQIDHLQARKPVMRTEVINAIADLAIAARAGSLLKTYQREWSWIDRQNYRDVVDADIFNEAFHGIEREFDKLAQVLAQSSGAAMTPAWEQEIVLSASKVSLSHNLNTNNLLVDLQAKLVTPQESEIGLLGTVVSDENRPMVEMWTNLGAGIAYAYGLPNPNTIVLHRMQSESNPFANMFPGDLTLRVRLWKLGD